MADNWYRFVKFNCDDRPHGAEWSIAVNRAYVDAVRDIIPMDAVLGRIKMKWPRATALADEPHWLHIVGSSNLSAASFGINFSDIYDGVDTERERVYSAQNCRDSATSFHLLDSFLWWAKNVEMAQESMADPIPGALRDLGYRKRV